MVFSNLFFLYLFFPICFISYFATKNATRNTVLILFSLLFYAWGEPVFLWLLLLSSVINFAIGKGMERHADQPIGKIAFGFGLIFNLGFLLVFKYTGFLIENLNAVFSSHIPIPDMHLPIGISFYTFRALSYIIDCYWGKVKPEKSYPQFLLFLSLFPTIVAGPIVRYSTIGHELRNRTVTPTDLSEGFTRIVIGLSKKVILSDHLGDIVTQFLGNDVIGNQTTLGAWYGVILYSMQIYFDFSGYSDMAIGIGRVFGFHFDENFRHPFLCKDITEFWQRWHISLGTFFRDYVLYIPIFGKRRKYGGLFLVWFCTGLWHGASWNYIIWGLYYGCFVLFEQLMGKKRMRSIPIVLRHLYNKLVIIVGFGIFYFEDTKKLGIFLKTLFGFGGNGFSNAIVTTSFQNNVFLILLALICCFPLLKIPKAMMQKSPAMHITLSFAGTLCCVALLIISSILLVDATNKPFLYLRF